MITVNFNQIHVDNDIALGNHMFQYALCRLVALKNGYNFFIPYSGHLGKCFPGIDLGINDGNTYGFFGDSNTQEYNARVFDVPDFTNLHGYFQTEKYFEGHEDLVKSWFPIDADNDNIKQILEKYSVEEYCYIHIRGSNNKGSYIMLDKYYYLNGIEEVKKLKKDIKFVIITDDYDVSKLYFPELDVISSNVMDDFKAMYFSKYAIISNSTFSWWSCWLSDKIITIAPNRWYNHNVGGDFFPADIKSEKFIYIN